MVGEGGRENETRSLRKRVANPEAVWRSFYEILNNFLIIIV